ncbi:MAG: hypothetical protein GX483_02700 [Actinomycetaceae bacterium]|nr:hypothetical protein [Actinomycetaceae bacterium]
MLKDLEIDPELVKDHSKIDRLGNLSPKHVSVSELLTLIAWDIKSHSGFATQDCTNPPASDASLNPAVSLNPAATPLSLDTPPKSLDFDDISSEFHASLRLQIRSSVSARQHLWVGFIPADCLHPLQSFFGADLKGEPILKPIGPTFIPGRTPSIRDAYDNQPFLFTDQLSVDIVELAFTLPHIPVAINPSTWCQTWAQGTHEQQQFLNLAFNGVDSVSISSRNYAALQACGTDLIPSSWIYRSLRSPKFWAYTVVFLYSALRALPLTFVKHFHGSILLLWTMDIATAIPYTWGVLAFITDRRPLIRFLGLVVTIVTFVAPYVYFWTHGRHYPPKVIVVVVAMIVGAIAFEVLNYLRDRLISVALSRRGA